MIKINNFLRYHMPAFLFDDRQSRQGTRIILIVILGVNVLHARFILIYI